MFFNQNHSLRPGRRGSVSGASCAASRSGIASAVGSRAPTRMRNTFALLALGLFLLSGVAQAGSEPAAAPLDLNRATAAELEALPGIGEVKAAAILAVRDARGGFESMDELESVRGIGPSLAAKLRPLLKLGARPPQAGARTAKK